MVSNELATVNSNDDTIREAIRKRVGTRLVTIEEAGTGVDDLPPGVFGFSFSAGAKNAPLFTKRSFQCFEVHKLADGSVNLLVFVNESHARAIEAGAELTECFLYPEPWGEATHALVLPLKRIGRNKGVSRDQGNYIKAPILGA